MSLCKIYWILLQISTLQPLNYFSCFSPKSHQFTMNFPVLRSVDLCNYVSVLCDGEFSPFLTILMLLMHIVRIALASFLLDIPFASFYLLLYNQCLCVPSISLSLLFILFIHFPQVESHFDGFKKECGLSRSAEEFSKVQNSFPIHPNSFKYVVRGKISFLLA